ncbi:amidohydrolase family protein [Paraburkholderia sp. SARCC-3016]|uniref:amidohydrolase family protein n=1 Tax=Paraburkholderia sp. SARCC-3016 TaxID=3058611 RepID=UPI002809A60A|nr:amidohydrolase family protein [Paraburkholderia sp. SARCC-3016]MDQ7975958.1 amidohydrolase family protein [Paraburkholderia sp. SARCC-3016]
MTKPCLGPLPTPAARPITMPPHACDCHAHVFGPYARFALADERSYTPPENPADRFIAHLDGLGFERGVLVTASVYGTDNASLVDALQRFPARLRGVAVLGADTPEAELDALTEHGVRAARFNLFRRDGQAVYRNGAGLDALRALAPPKLAARGWHAQIWVHAPDLPELEPLLRALSIGLVIDHMGRMSVANGTADAGFQRLIAMLADGAAWTKISGADRVSAQGAPYDDVAPFFDAILAANPQQVVWGSDWPHVNYFDAARMPDDAVLLERFARAVPDESLRRAILVDNPARLYGFAS